MTERDFYKKIEGRDDIGTPNAMCSLVILKLDANDEPAEVTTVTTMNGAVYLAIVPNGLSMIDVMFEEPMDYDYIQMGGLCEQFNRMVADANVHGSVMPSLVLSVSEQGDLTSVMSCVSCAWSYIPTSAEKICTGIRFIMETKHIHFLAFNDEQVNLVLNELEDEIISGDVEEQRRDN